MAKWKILEAVFFFKEVRNCFVFSFCENRNVYLESSLKNLNGADHLNSSLV